MKIIAEVFQLPSGSFIPQLYGVKEDGQVDRPITDTLLDFVSELHTPSDVEFESLLSLAEGGKYIPKNPSLPDFGVNDKNVWLLPPKASSGCLCIANENIPDYSLEDGQPQQFSVREFHIVLEHWRNFQKMIRIKGAANIVGEKFEISFR